jgi:hypothetical protein
MMDEFDRLKRLLMLDEPLRSKVRAGKVLLAQAEMKQAKKDDDTLIRGERQTIRALTHGGIVEIDVSVSSEGRLNVTLGGAAGMKKLV